MDERENWETRRPACEGCGRDFGCGAGGNWCWCVAETVPPDVLAELRERYRDCLCPDCLARAAGVQPTV